MNLIPSLLSGALSLVFLVGLFDLGIHALLLGSRSAQDSDLMP